MKVATRRLLEEQIAVVIVLESGKKDDAMWHVPHLHPKTSASFYDKTGVQLFFIENLKWPMLIHY